MQINKSYSELSNFWELNPQMVYIKPFSELYKSDKDKNKKVSSKTMWCIFFMNDPDEEKNQFIKIPHDERLQMLKEEFDITFDIENEIVKECNDYYNEFVLSPVERSLKELMDFVTKRSKILRNMVYNAETMKNIDDAMAKNLKIYEDLKKAQDLFEKSKKEVKARGGRNLTLSEKNII